MNIVGWIILAIYAAGVACVIKGRHNIWAAAKEETEDFGAASWAILIFVSPILLLFIFFLLLMPLVLTQGWMHDSRPDGCYRQTTSFNAATKTNQTHYEPVPCPENRIINK